MGNRVLHNQIRILRELKGIAQAELAECVGTSRETIGKLERGVYQNPSFKLVYDIAAFFEKPIEDVFKFVEE